MKEKLQTSRGETLVEVLACVLICSLSIALLVGAVSVSVRIDLQAQAADREYYEVLSQAERQNFDQRLGTLFGQDISSGVKISIVTNAVSANRKLLNVYFYGSEELLSFSPEEGGGP